MQDKRKFKRCLIKEKAWINEDGLLDNEASVFDVSMGGVRILLANKIDVGSKLSGRFKIVPYMGEFFVKGEVVWSKAVADDNGNTTGYAVGIIFNKVNTIPFE